MKAYIYKGQILTYAQAITHVAVSTTYPSTDHLELSEEQYQFYLDNQSASADEVWNMEPAPAYIPEPMLRVVQANPYLMGKSLDEIKATDITLLENLHKVSLKTRGYIYATKYYLEPEQLNLAFEILYEEVKDANKYTIGQTRTFNWYDENGALKITKTMSEDFNAVQSASHEYNKRVARCLYLKYPEGEFMSNPQVKWAIDYLNKRYEAEVLDYERNNTDALHQRIINETDTTALQILNTVVEGQTFRDRILYIVVDDYIIG